MGSQLTLFGEIPSKKILLQYKQLKKNLEEEYQRYSYLLQYGGQDPFWPDGTNLNLIRNHIIYYKGELLKLNTTYSLSLPDSFYWNTPEEVDKEYQAPGSKSGRLYDFKRKAG
ncbi:hypothetical protein [Dehalobacter sp. TeCB1]|uniref:hypothetical protein n=1 Tax=Dehalobacter sp. TeCB1 TaxID=1843715 RepID=UPI00083AF102|nr:hypothetical protein [Dehalobacter sp. TeCB1]OCZ50860.1 hypothetical protein A7D23_14275 [Dehalobacter sp. TeCB1]